MDFAHISDSGFKQTINYYRGFDELAMKSRMAKNIISHCRAIDVDPFRYMPLSFVLCPSASVVVSDTPKPIRDSDMVPVPNDVSVRINPDLNERIAFRFCEAECPQNRKIWIAKSTNGAKGENIFISSSVEAIITFIDQNFSLGKRNPSWLVQRYIDRPLLYKVGITTICL